MYSILLVEDEKLELDTLKNYVDWEKLGIDRVYTARGGRSALECISTNDPDIMITDIQMPGMTGTELARIVREEGYSCKIIFLTGYDKFEYAKAAIQVQAEDYLLKPFAVDEVEGLVAQVLKKIKRERHSQEASRLAGGRIIEQACVGKLENPQESCRSYFQKDAVDVHFCLIGLYGSTQEQQQIVHNMQEVVHDFSWEDMYFVILSPATPVDDALDRMFSQWGSSDVRSVRSEGRVPFAELHKQCTLMLEYQDALFFGDAGARLVATENFTQSLPATPDLIHDREQLVQAIQSGEESQAVAQLRSHLASLQPLGRHACLRDAYSLYLYVKEKMPRRKGESSQEPELLEDILHSNTYSGMERSLVGYIKGCCRLYQKDHGDYLENWVRQYIAGHYSEVCSAEEMAAELRMSPNYLRKKFKEATGQTLLEYLTDVRLAMAAQLLKRRDLKVKEVSIQVGYDNISYFTQLFAKKYGVTPNEYKKMVQ